MPLPQRFVHPSIADPDPNAVRNGTAPLFQYPDGKWNHGEGFAPPGKPDADYGGWFGLDDGSHVGATDIHIPPYDGFAPTPNDPVALWHDHQWVALHPESPELIEKLHGYLRPDGIALPDTHPRYGFVGPYIDQGAFELFRPKGEGPSGSGKIVIVMLTQETKLFPSAWVPDPVNPPGALEGRDWLGIYRGYFSPDGLVRNEHASSFLANTAEAAVDRQPLQDIANWKASGGLTLGWWPLLASPVLSQAGRQPTLNEQRYMQLLNAILVLLQEDSPRNPLGEGQQLSPTEIEERVVVVFSGSSNGGLQAQFAAMRYPERLHGIAATFIDPSIQRLYNGHDFANHVAWLTGLSSAAQVREGDHFTWGQYAWSQGYWVHDLSYLPRFLRGQTKHPAAWAIGDEDLTSTGSDWIPVVTGTGWSPSGAWPSPVGAPVPHLFSWMSCQNAGHGRGSGTDPYVGGTTFNPQDITHGVIEEAVSIHAASSVPLPPIPSADRTAGQQLRHMVEPHEWALGRLGAAMPDHSTDPVLRRDDAWFAQTQPGAAGSWLGMRESMFIKDYRLYVISGEGVVSRFHVESASQSWKRELVKDAHSNRGGPEAVGLGQGGTALTALDTTTGWEVLAGTRRHLFRLDKDSLSVLSSVELPWEIAHPHHLTVADVLPGPGAPGKEIIYASVHGGLVFYRSDLTPLWEWTEPGIKEFAVTESTGGQASVTILSSRGLVADVQFDVDDGAWKARLLAATRPLQKQLTDPNFVPTAIDPDPPSQGGSIDMEFL